MKGRVKAIKLKYILFLFGATLLAALPLRVYQLFALVEKDTGFYSTDNFTIPLLYVLLCVYAVVAAVLAYMSAEIPVKELPIAKNKLLGAAAGVLGVGLLWSVAEDLIAIIKGVINKTALVTGGYFSELFSEQGGIITIIKILAAFLGAVFLFVFCASHFTGRGSYKEQKILALMPMLWAMCCLIQCLMQKISYLKVSELVFEIGLYAFLMVFLMNFARISSSIADKGCQWQIFGFGLSAAVFGVLVSIPRFILIIMNKPAVEGHAFSFPALAAAVFIVFYAFASLGVGFYPIMKVKKDEDVPETGSGLIEEEQSNIIEESDDSDDD